MYWTYLTQHHRTVNVQQPHVVCVAFAWVLCEAPIPLTMVKIVDPFPDWFAKRI